MFSLLSIIHFCNKKREKNRKLKKRREIYKFVFNYTIMNKGCVCYILHVPLIMKLPPSSIRSEPGSKRSPQSFPHVFLHTSLWRGERECCYKTGQSTSCGGWLWSLQGDIWGEQLRLASSSQDVLSSHASSFHYNFDVQMRKYFGEEYRDFYLYQLATFLDPRTTFALGIPNLESMMENLKEFCYDEVRLFGTKYHHSL